MRDYFAFDYKGFKVSFVDDFGKWYFRMWKGQECIYESGMLTNGNKLTLSAIEKAAELIQDVIQRNYLPF
jgi:hypothetical protein